MIVVSRALRQRDKAIWGIGLALVSLGAPAAPDDAAAPAAAATDEVIVEAARDRDAKAGVPSTQATVTREDLTATVNLFDVEDALKYLPGIEVRKRYVGDRSSPLGSRTSGGIGLSARGLVYADGLLLANLLGNDNNDYTPRWGMVGPEEVERIDVLYGPYSALYAGNSMGAVVKMITRMPTGAEGHAKAQYFSQQFSAYSTDDTFDGQQYSLSLGDRVGPVAAWLALNHVSSISQPIAFAAVTSAATTGAATTTGALGETDQYDVQRYITGATSIDDTRQDTAKLKLSYDISDQVRALYTFGYWHNHSEIGYSSYLRDAAGATVLSGNVDVGGGKRIAVAASSFGLQAQALDHTLHGLELAGDHGLFTWRITGSDYAYRNDARRKQNASTGAGGTLTAFDGTGWQTLDTIGTWGNADQPLGHHISIGTHNDAYVLDTTVLNMDDWATSATGTRASAFGGRTRTSALFVQDAWGFAPGWIATVGVRAEHWVADQGRVSGASATQLFAGRSGSYTSPKLALQWQTPSAWKLSLATGVAYRLPTVAELFQGTIPNSQNTVTYNNPNLKPEHVESANFDAERQFHTDYGSGWLRATAFYERNRNALLKQPIPSTDPLYTTATGATTTYWSNIDEVKSKGAELAWHINNALTRGLDVDGSVTFAHSLITQNSAQPSVEGSWQNRVPKWRARMVVAYRPTADWSVSAGGRYSGLQRNGYPNADIRPNTYLGFAPYLVFDARATWKPIKSVTVAAGLDNVTNRLYYQFHPYPGRTFNLELRYDY